MFRNFLIVLSVFLLLIPFSHPTTVTVQERADSFFRIIFYNTENLFDTINDTITDDDDFLPDGRMRWGYTRYRNKINSLYKVLAAAGYREPPDIACFCEIENRNVLEALVNDTYLSRFNYGIVHAESNDPRGIDVGIIYRRDRLDFICAKNQIPSVYKREEFRTRDVLYAKFSIGGDTIHIFLNHWPSRRGGVFAGEAERRNLSAMIRWKADSINRSVFGKAKIIVGGDFNCTPSDDEIETMIIKNEDDDNSLTMINLTNKISERGEGTYKYRGTWEMLDQVIISGNLLEAGEGVYVVPDSLRVFSPDFLLTRDVTYQGFKPFSTYNGYRYTGGFSDHLPLIIDLKIQSPDH